MDWDCLQRPGLTNPSIHLDAVLAKRKQSRGSPVRNKGVVWHGSHRLFKVPPSFQPRLENVRS